MGKKKIIVYKKMFKKYDQIAYIPDHAEGCANHPDIEFGFITEICPDCKAAFCQYWNKDLKTLRTKSNGEKTSFKNLVHHITQDEKEIFKIINIMDLKKKE